MNSVSYGLMERLKLEKAAAESGYFVDRTNTIEDVKGWIDNPETYPKKFRRNSLYLMRTFTCRAGYPEVTALVWCVDQVIPVPCPLRA